MHPWETMRPARSRGHLAAIGLSLIKQWVSYICMSVKVAQNNVESVP